MTVWLLTAGLLFETSGTGVPFLTEHECKQAAVMAVITVNHDPYHCTEVPRTAEHDAFFVELERKKRRLARARLKRQQERALQMTGEEW